MHNYSRPTAQKQMAAVALREIRPSFLRQVCPRDIRELGCQRICRTTKPTAAGGQTAARPTAGASRRNLGRQREFQDHYLPQAGARCLDPKSGQTRTVKASYCYVFGRFLCTTAHGKTCAVRVAHTFSTCFGHVPYTLVTQRSPGALSSAKHAPLASQKKLAKLLREPKYCGHKSLLLSVFFGERPQHFWCLTAPKSTAKIPFRLRSRAVYVCLFLGSCSEWVWRKLRRLALTQ